MLSKVLKFSSRAIREGYDTWAAVTELDFEEVAAGSGSDIKANFMTVRFGTGNHNDPWPFDGQGGVLAHATMPENGALHFDDDENWTYMDAKKIASGDYTDILAVAIHEGGHTLGLSHSRDETSIMAPFYHETVDSRGNYMRPALKSDDISSIQDIYGRFFSLIFRNDYRVPTLLLWYDRSVTSFNTVPNPIYYKSLSTDVDLEFVDVQVLVDVLDFSPTNSIINSYHSTNIPSLMVHSLYENDTSGPRTSPFKSGSRSSSGSGSTFEDSGFHGRTTTSRPSSRSWFGSFFGGDDITTTRRPSKSNGDSSFGNDHGSSSSGSSRNSGSSSSCPNSVDAYAPSDSFSYLFSGSNVYALSGRKIHKVYQIRELFPDGPLSVEAAVFNPISGMMLLFFNRQVYGYHFSRLRVKFQIDSGYPKRLPSDITFSPSGAIRWINGHQILLSNGDEFSVYDEFWNQSTMKNRISSYLVNLPIGVKGMESRLSFQARFSIRKKRERLWHFLFAFFIINCGVLYLLLYNQSNTFSEKLFSHLLNVFLLQYFYTNVIVHFDLKGAPPKVGYFIELLELIAKSGATGVLIEWEDMFPWSGELEIVRSTDAYNVFEVRMILGKARALGLEVIPLVQTFGHMEWILKYEKFRKYRDTDRYPQVICIGDEEALDLIKLAISQVADIHKPFGMKRFHVGLDEAFQVNYLSFQHH
ncbi:Matrixin [Dictyocaulus viviparus]|uniref:Matrixin n=1 Tax=Dictyocaulus viviparus TaxID=29172 RepID=A0A0D8YAC3_DICVI|nr:Matrixin [Dictyocaulus viviparus]